MSDCNCELGHEWETCDEYNPCDCQSIEAEHCANCGHVLGCHT